MPTILKSNSVGISFNDLEDGQLAVILNCDADQDIGKVAQRLGDELIIVGEPRREVYEDPDYHNLCLRVLENGELIVVDENE
jgi:hypothetical protein